jgi:hypothetical protein
LTQKRRQFEALAHSLECSKILAPFSGRVIAGCLRPFVKQHEIVHADFSRTYPIQQFLDFSSGCLEVELANGQLGPADGIADGLLQLLSASFALGVAEFFQGATQITALQSGLALLAGRNCSGRCLLPTTLLRYRHSPDYTKSVAPFSIAALSGKSRASVPRN